jgi:hypothetical protein
MWIIKFTGRFTRHTYQGWWSKSSTCINVARQGGTLENKHVPTSEQCVLVIVVAKSSQIYSELSLDLFCHMVDATLAHVLIGLSY